MSEKTPDTVFGPVDFAPGAAARRLGVAVTTLRSWDRRYGLGASRISAGGHRRYSQDDLVRLENMCALVADGVPVADAARAVSEDAHGRAPRDRGPAAAADKAPGRSGGGHTLPTGDNGSRAARGLARAAMRLDTAALNTVLDRAFGELGVAEAWQDVVQPVLYGMGRKWESGMGSSASDKYVEVEHLLSECVLAALHRAAGRLATSDARAAGRRLGTRGVLLACTATELHTLPLHALEVALLEHRVPTRMFGAALPDDALLRAVERTGPSAVVLWSQHRDTAAPAALDGLHGCGTAVLAAGPGWNGIPLPHGAQHLTGLAQAVEVIAGRHGPGACR